MKIVAIQLTNRSDLIIIYNSAMKLINVVSRSRVVLIHYFMIIYFRRSYTEI